MENTKLISLLKTLDKDEVKEFTKFVVSPFHLKDRPLKPFFDAIMKYYPEFNNPKFTKENIYRKLYPGKKYDDTAMRKLSSYLYKMGEEYLVYKSMEKRAAERDILLMEELRFRGLNTSFRGLAKKLDKDIKPENFSLDDYFISRYRYARSSKFISLMASNYMESGRKLEEQMDSATGFFLFTYHYLKNQYNTLNRNFAKDERFEILEAITESFDKEEFLNPEVMEKDSIKLVLPWIFLEEAFSDPENDEIFYNAKNSVVDNLKNMGRGDRYRAFIFLHGIIAIRSNLNKEGAIKEAFELYKLQIEYDSLRGSEQKYMTVITFRNIVSVAVNLRQIEWLENFIKTHIKEIEPVSRDNMKYFSLSRLEKLKGNNEMSLNYINRIKYESFVFNVDAREMNLVLLYDMGKYQEAYDFIETTRKYFTSRDNLPDYFKVRHANFLKYFKLILKYTDKNDDISAEMDFKKLSQENQVTGKDWLLTRFKKLIKS